MFGQPLPRQLFCDGGKDNDRASNQLIRRYVAVHQANLGQGGAQQIKEGRNQQEKEEACGEARFLHRWRSSVGGGRGSGGRGSGVGKQW